MELAEVTGRLPAFIRAMTGDAAAEVLTVEQGTGHAGFSYLFDVRTSTGLDRYFLRLPPPNVKLEGTADVLRQVAALNALDGTAVPHAPVIWSGDDPRWFACPYFVVPRIEGDVFTGEWVDTLSDAQCRQAAREAMRALAGIHRVDPRQAPYLGNFHGFEIDVTRWDRFYERAADQHLLALQPLVRQRLLDSIPNAARIAIYHGDFQWANLMYSPQGTLLAVIDWELTGIGATLNDVGWMCLFNEPRAWNHPNATNPRLPEAEEMADMYREYWGSDPGDIAWFQALAAYKFAIISGLNLSLHRRGKRPDPHWEERAPSMKSLMEYAASLLSP